MSFINKAFNIISRTLTSPLKGIYNLIKKPWDSKDFLKKKDQPSDFFYKPIEDFITNGDEPSPFLGSEKKRCIERRLVDYEFIKNNLVTELIPNENELGALKSYIFKFSINLKLYFKVIENSEERMEEVDLTEYLMTTTEYSPFDNQFVSYLEVNLILPPHIYNDIIKAVMNSEPNSYHFKIKIDRTRYSNTGSSNAIVPTVLPETSGIFDKEIYEDVELIIMNLNSMLTGEFSLSEYIMKNSSKVYIDARGKLNSTASRRLKLELFSKAAININRATYVYNVDNVDPGNLLNPKIKDSLLNILVKRLPNLKIFTDSVHNTNKVRFNFEELNLEQALAHIEENAGLYTFGQQNFIHGENLYIGDSQVESESFKNEPKIFITVVPTTSGYIDLINGACTINESISLTKQPKKIYYAFTSEANVQIHNNHEATIEKFGNIIKLDHNGKRDNLLLPRSLIDSTTRDSKVKVYKKTTETIFFETKLLSEYNDQILVIDVVLRDFDPDFFFIGKHVVLHFISPNYSDEFTNQYKILNKTVQYNKGTETGDRLRSVIALKLCRVVNEIPYYYKDQIEVKPIFDPDSTDKETNKITKIEEIDSDIIELEGNRFLEKTEDGDKIEHNCTLPYFIDLEKRIKYNIYSEMTFKTFDFNKVLEIMPPSEGHKEIEVLSHLIRFTESNGKLMAVPYKCSAGASTIGFGHLVDNSKYDISKNSIIDMAMAEYLMQKDILAHKTGFINIGKRTCPRLPTIYEGLSWNEKAALMSFVFNLGPGVWWQYPDNYKLLCEKNFEELAEKILKYNKVKIDGEYVVDDGLAARRELEVRIMLGK